MPNSTEAFGNLVNDRIHSLDCPRKSWLLATSKDLKPAGKTLIPFPEFQAERGRSDSLGETEVLTYTKSDALNMLMAFAGNEETGELLGGALINEVRGDGNLQPKIHALVDKLHSIPEPSLGTESEYLFQNALTLAKLEVPKSLLVPENIRSNGSVPLAEGFVVTIDRAKEFLGQIIDQLLQEEALDQYTGKKIQGEYAGLVGCFYNSEDASYLGKMLSEYLS